LEFGRFEVEGMNDRGEWPLMMVTLKGMCAHNHWGPETLVQNHNSHGSRGRMAEDHVCGLLGAAGIIESGPPNYDPS
jgi:hypothetical protein